MTDAERSFWARYIRSLADLMGLKDWKANLLEQATDDDHDAEVFCVPGRRIANIKLSPRFNELDPERQRQTFCHELVHCFFAAMDELVMSRWQGHGYTAFLILFEYGVDAVADAIAPHLPLPLSGRSFMSLKKGYGKKSISANVKTEMAHGKSQKQSVAIALDTARKAAAKAGKPNKGPQRKKKG